MRLVAARHYAQRVKPRIRARPEWSIKCTRNAGE
jgi:hypothetical protein